jgi:hypothetical protein
VWFFDIELVLPRDPGGATPLASVNLSRNASLRFSQTNLHYVVRYWQLKGPACSARAYSAISMTTLIYQSQLRAAAAT